MVTTARPKVLEQIDLESVQGMGKLVGRVAQMEMAQNLANDNKAPLKVVSGKDEPEGPER